MKKQRKEAYTRQPDGSIKPTTQATTDIEVEGSESLGRLYDKLALVSWKPPTPAKTVGAFNLTDMGNAERLAERYGHAIRYCYDRKRWLVWNGRVWEWDIGAKVAILAKLTVRSIYHEAGDEDDKDRRSDIVTHAKRSESDHRLNAMINQAQSEPGIPIQVTELDNNPWLLNCLNGTIDLKTGKLLPHNKDDLNTVIIPVEYNPDAKCPLWLDFIEWATGEDKELATYIQRALGYTLTGDITEEVVFFIYGLGNNGKTTLTMTFRRLMAGYAERLDADDLMIKDRKTGGGPKEGIANLLKKRYALGSEVRDGRRLDVGQLKDMTGGETMKARHLYEREFEFMPTHKLWLYGNKKPTIQDTSLAVWRRVKLIEFKQTIPDDKIDRMLGERLEAELPGILAWAVQGCLDWQSQGFNEPRAVKDATEAYRHEQDVLGDYIEDCCSLEITGTVPKGELREHYETWCKDNKVDVLFPRQFRASLIERGITDYRGAGGKHYWKGIRLLTESELTARLESDKSDNKLPICHKTPHARGLQKDFMAGAVRNVTKVTDVTNLQELPEGYPDYPKEPCGCGSELFWPGPNDWLCVNCHPRPEDD
jgi:putative DNA primase/helicase